MDLRCSVELRADLIQALKEEHQMAQASQRHTLQEHRESIEQLLLREFQSIQRTLVEHMPAVGTSRLEASEDKAAAQQQPERRLVVPSQKNEKRKVSRATSFGGATTVLVPRVPARPEAQGIVPLPGSVGSTESLERLEGVLPHPQAQPGIMEVTATEFLDADEYGHLDHRDSDFQLKRDSDLQRKLEVFSHESQVSSTENGNGQMQIRPSSTSAGIDEGPGRFPESRNSVDSAVEDDEDRAEWDDHIKETINKQLTRKDSLGYFLNVDFDFDQEGTSRQLSSIAKFASSASFNYWCSAIVLSNAAFIGADTSVTMSNALRNRYSPDWIKTINLIFTGLFSIELLIRIYAFRKRFFLGSEWRWNVFDLSIVLSAILEEVSSNLGSVGFLRICRGLRMFRVLRLVRVFEIIRDLRLMVCSVLQSFISFFWALLLLFVMTYLASIFFMQATLMQINVGGPRDEDFIQHVEQWYGSLPRAFVSMIMCFSGGVDWLDVLRPLQRIHWLYETAFVLYILFIVIGVLNVLTGIFVERAQELSGLDRDLVIQAEKKRNEAFLHEMKNIFEEADADGSNRISWDEFREFLKKEDIKAYMATQQLDAFDPRQLFNIMESEDDEGVGIEDFIMGCMRLKGLAKSVDVVALLQESRKQNRRVRDKMADIQEQLNGLAHLCGGQVYTEEVQVRSSRRKTSQRKKSYIGLPQDGSYSQLQRYDSSDEQMS